MDPELNPDAPDELRSDLTPEQQSAADKAQQSAFAAAFGDDSGGAASTQADPASTTAAAHAPAAGTTDTTSSTGNSGGKTTTATDDDDPFRDLNPKVRDMLAEIPTLQRDLESMKGRVAPTQRRLAELERENERLRKEAEARGTTTPAAGTTAPSELAERVRGELPEVVDLIEERVQAALKGVKPAANHAADDPASATAATTIDDDPAVRSLKKVHPDWDKTMVSTDYRLWVSAKGADYQRQILASEDPVEVSASLTEFKAHQQRVTGEQNATSTRRQTRAERAVEPGGHRASGGNTAPMTEHDAMVAAFNSP